MHVPLDPSSRAPSPSTPFPLSVGPLYERAGRRVVRAGVLAIADGLVAPRPFWELLQELAVCSEWLRATFALASRPTCYGVARAEGASPVAGFRGTWHSAPRLTLLLAGKGVAERALESAIGSCLLAGQAHGDDDPFPSWRPGDPWLPLFWEAAC